MTQGSPMDSNSHQLKIFTLTLDLYKPKSRELSWEMDKSKELLYVESSAMHFNFSIPYSDMEGCQDI